MAVLYSFCLYSNPFCLVLSTDDDSCHAGWVTSNVGYSPRDRRGSSRHRSKAVSFLFGNFLSSIIGRRMSEIQSPISSSPSEIPPLIFSCPFANPGHIIFSFTLHSSWVFLRDALKVQFAFFFPFFFRFLTDALFIWLTEYGGKRDEGL